MSEYNNNNNRIETFLYVPTRHVGKIIGRQGTTIKQITENSGAYIKVCSNRNFCQEETKILLSGSNDSIEKAKSIIDSHCQDKIQTKHENYRNKSYGRKEESWDDNYNNNYQESSNIPTQINWSQVAVESTAASNKRWQSLPPIEKFFYFEHNEVKNLSEEQLEEVRVNMNKLAVSDHSPALNRKIPNIVSEFHHSFENYPQIMQVIKTAGFDKPTPIQCQSWPILLSGYDLIGIAQTGTGKTLSFLLPALIHIDQQKIPRDERGGPTCLILSPTRELAKQIEDEVKKFDYKGIKSCCLYGGASRSEQISTVQDGVEIVIATPGRLNDLYANKIIRVDSVSFLVLDEADRMLDMGFEAEIKKFLIDVRPDRQTVMTSATWPPAIRRLAQTYLKDPFQVNVGSLDLTACHNVTQLIEFLDADDKLERIVKFVENQIKDDDKVLIFVGRKITADFLSTEFSMRNVHDGLVQVIHGDREQYDREEALREFKSGVVRILIATDVASRGLDINNINYVINYDFPKHIEEYVHRIGRTGRAGKKGTSLTFMTRNDWNHAQELIILLNEANQYVPENLILMAERFANNARNKEIQGNDRTNEPRRMGRGCFKCGEIGHRINQCTAN